MGDTSQKQYTNSIELVASSFKNTLFPFITEVLGILTKIESDCDMLKSEVLQALFQILIQVAEVDAFILFVDQSTFDEQLFATTIEFLI